MNAATFHSVRFSGSRSGVHPLTWGQRWIWRGLTGHAPHYGYLGWPVSVDIPTGCGLDVVLSAFETVLGRHETLRTRYFLDEHGVPRQVVPSVGELTVEVRDADSADVPETVRQLEEELSSPPFTIPEISVRAAVVTSAGAPKSLVLGVFHMATDASGLRHITRDLRAILRAHADATDLPELPPVSHPADRVRHEAGQGGLKRSARAVMAWQKEVENFPRRTMPPERHTPESPRLREHIMRSKAVSLAATAVAGACRASVDTVILACTAKLLGRVSGQNKFGFLMLAHNRFDEESEFYSGTMVQSFPVCVELGADSLAELIRRTHFSVLTAALSCLGNPDDVSSMLQGLFGSEGREADLSCAVNMYFPELGNRGRGGDFETVTSDQAEKVMSQTRFSVGEGLEKDDWEFYLNAYQEDDEFILSLRMDTAVLPSPDIVRLLADLERLLVEALPGPGA